MSDSGNTDMDVDPEFEVVAAIDFGTTYSGYAYSMTDDYKKDKLNISSATWKSATMISPKTPTSVLLDSDKALVAFGYDAESEYTLLAEKNEHENFYYFRRFKMELFNEIRDSKLTLKTTIRDINNKRLPAIDVFAHAIGYLQKHLLDHLNNRGMEIIHQHKIHWVLTIPAIWDDPAKQFMREAAKRANIPSENLTMALEPEAASIYCKHLSLEQGQDQKSFSVFQEGSRYLVLDAGGGTVDITIHEIQKDGRIRELELASGGPWGGTYVDNAFYKVLSEILGSKEFETYKREHALDVMEIYREFELQKRFLESECEQGEQKTPSRNITIKMPVTLKNYCKQIHHKDIQVVTSEASCGEGLTWNLDKLRISSKRLSDMFSEVCDDIVKHITKLLESSKVKGTKTILMVGGFSESQFLEGKIRSSFPDMDVVVPKEAGLAVLKGAVLFGHEPNEISVRVARLTYGLCTCEEFDKVKELHPRTKPKLMNNKYYCENIFSKHVQKGDVLEKEETQEGRSYVPLHPGQKSIIFNIYTSTEDNPKFIDDYGCKYLGTLEVDLSKLSYGSRKSVRVKFIFGGTEIKVVGKIEDTNEEVEVNFNFLEESPNALDEKDVYLDK